MIFFLAVRATLSKVTHEKYELPTTFSEEAQDLVNSTLRKRCRRYDRQYYGLELKISLKKKDFFKYRFILCSRNT